MRQKTIATTVSYFLLCFLAFVELETNIVHGLKEKCKFTEIPKRIHSMMDHDTFNLHVLDRCTSFQNTISKFVVK